MKKQLIYILMFLLLFSLYGCGNTKSIGAPEKNIEISKAIELISKAKSYEYTLFRSDSTSYGDEKVESQSKTEQKQMFEPFTVWAKTDSKLRRMNGDQERTTTEIYEVAQGEQMDFNVRYSQGQELNTNKDPVLCEWEKHTYTAKEQVDFTINFNKSNFEAQLYLLSTNIDSFKLAEDAEVKDDSVLKYDGYIEPTTALEAYHKYLRDYYVQMKWLDDLKNPSIKDLKSEITSGNVPDLQSGIAKLAYSEENIPVSLWINKDTYALKKVMIDETSVMQSLLEKEVPKFYPEREAPVVSKSLYTYEIKGVNKLKEITMPE